MPPRARRCRSRLDWLRYPLVVTIAAGPLRGTLRDRAARSFRPQFLRRELLMRSCSPTLPYAPALGRLLALLGLLAPWVAAPLVAATWVAAPSPPPIPSPGWSTAG